MKLYRVTLCDASGHCGYKFFGDKKIAGRFARKWVKDRKADVEAQARVASLLIPPSRFGLIKAFNEYGGHPNNG